MLNIICVNANDYLGCGRKYVETLFDMVRRNLAEGHGGRFVVFTDDDPAAYGDGITVRPLPHPGLKGWFNKLSMFKPGLFDDGDRVVYFDLDTLITGRLDEIVAYDGEFAILQDFFSPEGSPFNGWQSAVMAWPAGFGGHIWQSFVDAGFPDVPGGDQAWIRTHHAKADLWQEMHPDLFVSYKATSGSVPEKASVVCFHGLPRPHEVLDGWVPQVWKIGGLSRADLDVICNTETSRILSNIESACARNLPWFDFEPDHYGHVCIIGGGPSVEQKLSELRAMHGFGHQFWALNGAFDWLVAHGLTPHAHVILDARPDNAAFVRNPKYGVTYYVASQCDPTVLDALNGYRVVLFHNASPSAQELLERIAPHDKPCHLFGGGTTVGLKAMVLARKLGFRMFHLYGMDSSYSDGGDGHAYDQALNDGERILDVVCGNRTFKAAPWMVTQAQEFNGLANDLAAEGCTIVVAGDGLLPHVARGMMEQQEVDESGTMKRLGGFWWPIEDQECGPVIIQQVEHDVPEVLRHVDGRRLAVQAGGNVGVYPAALAQHFERVLTFEPDPGNFDCLWRNFQQIEEETEGKVFCRQGYFPGETPVRVWQSALGDERAAVGLMRNESNVGAHYILGGGDVEVLMLDDLHLDACDLIWLDVEGYELKALKGGVQTISAHHPVIVVENNGLEERYGAVRGDTIAWLEALGYAVVGQSGRDTILKWKE